MNRYSHITAVLIFIITMTSAASGDLINPGFESGDLTGWTTFGQGWRTGSGGDANSGTFGAVNDVLTTDIDNFRGIFQNVSVTEGTAYTAGVSIRAVNIENSSSWFELQWLDSGNGVIGQVQSSFVTADQGFTFMSVNNEVAPVGAVSASVRAIVQMPTPPAGDADFHIFDDFMIVPEPGTLGLMIAGCAGLSLLRNRNKKSLVR